VGLIAREIESRGIPTVCLTSALSITQAVAAPRALFVDFPLGHTAGKAHDRELQRDIVRRALSTFSDFTAPGIAHADVSWSEDDTWKDTAMRARSGAGEQRDERVGRSAEPVYQSAEDHTLAERALAEGGCPGCVWPADDGGSGAQPGDASGQKG
jgi:hypothetical protein